MPSSTVANISARNGRATMANSTAVAPPRARPKRRRKPLRGLQRTVVGVAVRALVMMLQLRRAGLIVA